MNRLQKYFTTSEGINLTKQIVKEFYPNNIMNEEDEEFIKHIDLDNPKFEERTKTHDWRNYVPDKFVKEWDSLIERERKIIAVMAEFQAAQEDWE